MNDPSISRKENRGQAASTIGWSVWVRCCALLLFWFAVLYSLNPIALAADQCPVTDWSPLIDRLVQDGYNRQQMEMLFSRQDVAFNPGPMKYKLRCLIRNRSEQNPSALPAMRPYHTLYEKGYLAPRAIAKALAYREKNRTVLDGVNATYCVPGEIVVAIMMVETRLGEAVGSKAAFNTLASMALAADLKTILPHLAPDLVTDDNVDYARLCCKEKGDWAYGELKALLSYAGRNSADPVSIPGSVFGAIGLCQFMPSSVTLYGVDADGDGIIDLFAAPDAIYSIANYLKKNGWSCGMTRRQQHDVILTYNKSHLYANTVQAIADRLRLLAQNREHSGTNDSALP